MLLADGYEEALDITDDQADRLIGADNRDRFEQAEFLATLISIKVSDVFSGKKTEYPRPSAEIEDSDDGPKKTTTPLKEADMLELFKLTN